MDGNSNKSERMKFQLKSAEEVYEKFKVNFKRRLRKFLNKHLRPCPVNCRFALLDRTDIVLGCQSCVSRNPEKCNRPEKFQPIESKEELIEEFKQRWHDPEIVLREYQGEAALLWVLGVWDNYEEFVNKQLKKSYEE